MPYTVIRRDNLLRRAMGKGPGPGDASNGGERDTGPEIAKAAPLREKGNQVKERVKGTERVKVREKVRTRGVRDLRADVLIVVGDTTHPIARRGKGARQANCKTNNKVVR